MGLGDGGGEDDQTCQINLDLTTTIGHSLIGNGQDTTVIYGKMIRIDINGRDSQNGQYGIPRDNPFVGRPGFLPEIYAYGLRNPYRFSFDDETGLLFLNDAGENDVEEADIIAPAGNYGWFVKEATFSFNPEHFALINGASDGTVNSNRPGVPKNMVDPLAEYAHRHNGAEQAVVTIGGFMYRGSGLPDLRGYYVFGDYSRSDTQPMGWILTTSAKLTDSELEAFEENRFPRPPVGAFHAISLHPPQSIFTLGFGRDNDGELYVMGNTTGIPSGNTGEVRKLVKP